MTAELLAQIATEAAAEETQAGGRTPQGPATVEQLAGGARRMINAIVKRARGGHKDAEPLDPFSLARWHAEVAASLETATRDAVQALRADGFSWQEIADGFDFQRRQDGTGSFSKQAAIKRFNH